MYCVRKAFVSVDMVGMLLTGYRQQASVLMACCIALHWRWTYLSNDFASGTLYYWHTIMLLHAIRHVVHGSGQATVTQCPAGTVSGATHIAQPLS